MKVSALINLLKQINQDREIQFRFLDDSEETTNIRIERLESIINVELFNDDEVDLDTPKLDEAGVLLVFCEC